jgi:CRP/FNR family transcriptional regulator
VIDKDMFDRIARALPMLEVAGPELVREFEKSAFHARIPAGADVFLEGDPVEAIALLISGVVRVYKIGETGRQITLYRFGDGQSCILTANAILSRKTFPAVATVEKDAEAVMVPADAFRDWVNRHRPWREFVFDLLSARLASVMELVDEIAFRRMDVRLADFVMDRARLARTFRITHQEIASELGSSREVISRLLEDLAGEGVIRTGRGEIEVLDPDALQERAGSPK